MELTIFGIKNCDTMKKAMKWLDDNGVAYHFHDYKKEGVPEAALKQWLDALGWETVINKRGTTWRKLDDETHQLHSAVLRPTRPPWDSLAVNTPAPSTVTRSSSLLQGLLTYL